MRTPSIYTPEQVITMAGAVHCGLPDGRWVAARPESWGGMGIGRRIKAAWLVFTGRADALTWTGQP